MMKNEPEATMTFNLEVRGFADGGFFPQPNTCEGEDRSPAMQLSEHTMSEARYLGRNERK